MKVKCKFCKTQIERDKAFKVVNGKINAYYCSEEEYKAVAKEKKFKEESISWVKTMCDIQSLGKHGTIIFNKLNKKLVDKYGSNSILLNTIMSCQDQVMNGFDNNAIMTGDGRIRYMMKVLEAYVDKGAAMTDHNNKLELLDYKNFEQSMTDIVYKKKPNKMDISELIKKWED